jgi:hypothetical protein
LIHLKAVRHSAEVNSGTPRYPKVSAATQPIAYSFTLCFPRAGNHERRFRPVIIDFTRFSRCAKLEKGTPRTWKTTSPTVRLAKVSWTSSTHFAPQNTSVVIISGDSGYRQYDQDGDDHRAAGWIMAEKAGRPEHGHLPQIGEDLPRRPDEVAELARTNPRW